MRKALLATAVLAATVMVVPAASAEQFHGVEFPQGARSFADVVASFDPVVKNGQPTPTFLDATRALGAPDHPEGVAPEYVSLGDGGSITVEFTDNILLADGTSQLDLWIFEIGPDVEDTFVEVSADGVTFLAVGKVFGSISGIDLDAHGLTPSDHFSFVRLTDDGNEGLQTGSTVGADIDAIGAISTIPTGTVQVEVRADEPGEFDLTVAGPEDSETATVAVEADGDGFSGSHTWASLETGSTAVTQATPPGWDLVSATCDDPSAAAEAGGVRFDLDPDETVRCTVVNARQHEGHPFGGGYDPAQCVDGEDNDADGLSDLDDPDCTDTSVGCVEDGVEAFDATPAAGAASGTVHGTGEPVLGGLHAGLAEAVHDVNCRIVVPAEDLVDEVVAAG